MAVPIFPIFPKFKRDCIVTILLLVCLAALTGCETTQKRTVYMSEADYWRQQYQRQRFRNNTRDIENAINQGGQSARDSMDRVIDSMDRSMETLDSMFGR